MISRTKIERKIGRKRNPKLKELIIRLKKQKKLEIADLLARPKRKAVAVNIDRLNKEAKDTDIIIIPGKVLGKGNLEHKLTLAAFSFSQEAREKLKNCKIISIEEAARNKDSRIIR